MMGFYSSGPKIKESDLKVTSLVLIIIEIYLINNGSVLSFQSIPVYVNQVGVSAAISNFASTQSVLYGLMAVFLAIFVGFTTNYFFARFIKK